MTHNGGSPYAPPIRKRLLITSPGQAAESRELLRAIVARIIERYPGWTFIIVAPTGRDQPGCSIPVEVHPFFHGGLSVNVMVGEVMTP